MLLSHSSRAARLVLCTRLPPSTAAASRLAPLLTQLCVSPPQFHSASVAREGFTAASLTAELAQRKKVLNSLLYRAKQRGFLELDLLVGGWAEANLPRLSDEELAAFGVLLEEENPDLWKWLTGQLPAPEAMQANPAFVQLRRHTEETLDAKSRSATRGKLGQDWVRGWGDSGLPSSGNQQ